MRSVRTPWQYRALPEGVLDPQTELDLLTAMRVGTLVVQSPIRAASTGRQVNAAPRALKGDARALALFAGKGAPPPPPPPAPAEQSTTGGGAAALPRGVREKGAWHLGCFLIAHVGAGAAADGADSIVAINLARRRVERCEHSQPSQSRSATQSAAAAAGRAAAGASRSVGVGALAGRGAGAVDSGGSTAAATAGSPQARPPPVAPEDEGFRLSRELLSALRSALGESHAPRSVPVLDGGPCHADAPLCLMWLTAAEADGGSVTMVGGRNESGGASAAGGAGSGGGASGRGFAADIGLAAFDDLDVLEVAFASEFEVAPGELPPLEGGGESERRPWEPPSRATWRTEEEDEEGESSFGAARAGAAPEEEEEEEEEGEEMATGRTRDSMGGGVGEARGVAWHADAADAADADAADADAADVDDEDVDGEGGAFSTARWLVQQRELTESMQRLYPASNAHAEPPPPFRLHLGEPAVALQLARRGRVRCALVVQGCAVWTSHQLLAEVARGSWGLCAARRDDVPIPQPPDLPSKDSALGGSLMAGAHPPRGRSAAAGTGRSGTTRRTASSLAHVGSRSSGRTGRSNSDSALTEAMDKAATAASEGVALWTECWSRRHPLAVEVYPGSPNLNPLW